MKFASNVGATALLFAAASTGPSSLLAPGTALVANASPVAELGMAADAAALAQRDGAEKRHKNIKGSARCYVQDPTQLAAQGVDFVIIGGGTAGLTLANRLTQDGRRTVAVIEAGGSGKGDPRIDVPGMFGAGLATEFDWNMTSQPNPATGVPGVFWPRGKVLGGSSALNFLVWDRPTARQELDAWEQLGNKGWNWATIYRWMKKAETFHPPSASQIQKMKFDPADQDYGYNGPVQASYPFYISKQVSNWLPALNSLGINTTTRMDGTNIGAAQQPATINPAKSTRSYSASASLWPNEGRPNLHVITNALVDKINFAKGPAGPAGLKAESVSFSWQGRTITIPARREVVVSAGAVHSPAVLERSGVGLKSVLDAAGIKQLIDLPVGENLQDHTYTAAAYELQPGNPTLDSLRNDPAYAAQQKQLYAANSRDPASILTEVVPSIGYLTLPELVGPEQAKSLVAEAAAYADSSTAPHKATLQKQVEFLKSGASTVGQMEVIGIDGYFAGSAPPEAGKNYVTFLAAQQHLLSRGTVHINSSDASVNPLIQPNYYSVPWDLKVATAGTSYLRKIAGTQAYGSYIVREAVPGVATDLTQYTRTTLSTEYHPIGTCSMLPRGKGGVVSPSLKVYGTQNVRVADASAAPSHTSQHIQSLAYAIAEGAAEFIQRENP